MATPAQLPLDPYAEKPSFWVNHQKWLWAVGVFVATVLATVFTFPPSTGPELAYAFAAPAIFWAYRRPGFKLFAGTLFAAQIVSWTLILAWLHHVSWLGVLLLGPFTGVWVGLWYLAVWWVMPQMVTRATPIRIFTIFGLAALWVVNEWTRTWVLTGFPWLPLAASQWQRLIILQIASYTGAAGISFILIVFNLGFAAYGNRLFDTKFKGLKRRSPEFMAAIGVLFFPSAVLLLSEVQDQNRAPLVRVALVQPDIPQSVKWEESHASEIFNTLSKLTLSAAVSNADLIVWPEASTPYPIKGTPQVQSWAEELVRRARVPLLLGSDSAEPGLNETLADGSERIWKTGAFVIDPVSGLQTHAYAKQHLVPFGEYVPLRPLLGWLKKIVPVADGDYTPGSDSTPLIVTTRNSSIAVGPLVCYEDLFPSNARAAVIHGAELLAVLTNDAWYGTGAAAYQHAAHSVLRAVETRRPVIRCGNNGWSGWIDEFGGIRGVMKNADDSVYYRGTRTFEVTRDLRWSGRQSFYTEHGDWFVGACAGLIVLAYLALRTSSPMPVDSEV